jgi:hypothetical protein
MKDVRRVTACLLLALLIFALWSSAGLSQKQSNLQASRLGTKASTNEDPQTKRRVMSDGEKLVRDVYARLMRYQSAAVDELAAREGKATEPKDYLRIELRDIRSGAIEEISNLRLSTMVTAGTGELIRIKPDHLTEAGGPTFAYYQAEWETTVGREWTGNLTIGELLKKSDSSVNRYTSYRVTVRLEGKNREYQALALYHVESASEKSVRPTAVDILDNVTEAMNTVYSDESPPVRAPWKKYIKTSLYSAVTRTINDARKAGQPLIPADAPIGYLPGDDISPTRQDLLAMGLADVCPGLRILRDGNDITNTTQNVIVGEPINLSLETQPEGDEPTDIQWSIPGHAIGNYIVNGPGPSGATSAHATPADLTSPAPTIYWIDGGNSLNVSVTCTVFGTSLTASTTFNVQKPTATITILSGNILVRTLADTYLYLTFGNPDGITGVHFDQSVQMPSGFSGGSTQWTQVILSTQIVRTDNAGNQQSLSGTNVIDGQFSYQFVYNGALEDSPSVRLEPDMSHWSRTDSFASYLMFRPSGSNTIWVPLRHVPWDWHGSATRTGTPNVWVLDPGSGKNVGPDVNSTAEPEWSGRAQDLQLH